jgi:adenine C2-methylase RlmN of 23S rRNA A2503 and tRNA A37
MMNRSMRRNWRRCSMVKQERRHYPLHLVHVNLIPWNPVPGMPLGRSERRRVLTFQRILRERGIACTVRVERGVSIAAACGQLAGGERVEG